MHSAINYIFLSLKTDLSLDIDSTFFVHFKIMRESLLILAFVSWAQITVDVFPSIEDVNRYAGLNNHVI